MSTLPLDITAMLQAIADVPCGEAFGPFDADQAAIMRQYDRLCVALGESGFLSQEVRFTFKASRAESYSRLDHAGRPELRSMMMDFRQLWMKGEPTYFRAVRNMLRRNTQTKGSPSASDEAVRQLDGIGRRYKEALGEKLMRIVDPRDVMRSLKEYSAEEVVEHWLYGGSLHWDQEHAKHVELWSRTQYEYSLSKAVHALCDCYFELHLFVQNILAEDSLLPPAPPRRGYQP